MEDNTISSQMDLRVQETIDGMTYMDDDFFTACMQNSPEAALLVLRTVMRKPDLVFAEKPQTQKVVRDLGHKSVQLDLYCISEKKYYDVEIQRRKKGADAHRARYYASILDANILFPGQDYENLPDVYVIFITEKDIPGQGRPFYEIERINVTAGQFFEDGSHILYINGEYRGKDALGQLMHDFRCTRPEEMNYEELRKPAAFFKETEEGRKQMGDAVQKLIDEFAEQLADEKAEKLANEKAEKLANEKAEKLANEKAEKLANEKAVKLADEIIKKRDQERALNLIRRSSLDDEDIAMACGLAVDMVREMRKKELQTPVG